MAGPSGDVEIPSKYMFFMADGKVHGNEGRLIKSFSGADGKALQKNKKTLYVLTSEDSERDLKGKVAGIGTLGTIEFLHMVTKDVVDLPQKKRMNSPGSNASDTLGPYDRPKKDNVWHVEHQAKKIMWGSAWSEVGGRVEGDVSSNRETAPKATDVYPMTWHGMPTEYYEDLFQSYGLMGMIHFTGADPILPLTCVRLKTSCLTFVPTQELKVALETETIARIFQLMQDPKDVLFEPALLELMKPAEAKPPATSSTKKDKDKASTETVSKNDDEGETGDKAKKTVGKVGKKAQDLLNKLQSLDDGEEEDQ